MSTATTVAVVLLLLLGAGVGGWAAGRGSAPERSNAAPAAAGSPGAASAGPVPAVATGGFARTAEGAGDALASYVRRSFALTVAPVEQGDAFVKEIAAPGAESRVAARFGTRGLLNGSPNAFNVFTPIRVLTTTQADGSIRATVWGNSVQGAETDDTLAQPGAVTAWFTVTARMTWGTDDTWKVSEPTDATGPTPHTMGEPDPPAAFGPILTTAGRTPGER
ncbi:hypothetical protein OG948_59005 (plasmid) [Embleya sp. NBC_00888]|uniref:hypothetical protein n=1 Tax=Embleya sp. NBC_00888 TaxID=2975960 RepID=UPI002F912255|nr:hypothetical protein OG948_59005 [Embleya sp. NBC_00888]